MNGTVCNELKCYEANVQKRIVKFYENFRLIHLIGVGFLNIFMRFHVIFELIFCQFLETEIFVCIHQISVKRLRNLFFQKTFELFYECDEIYDGTLKHYYCQIMLKCLPHFIDFYFFFCFDFLLVF